jgi:hypothetical protein
MLRWFGAIVVAAALAGCGGSTEPKDDGRVHTGAVIDVQLTSTDTALAFPFVATLSGEYAVFVEVGLGNVFVTLRDSISGVGLPGATAFRSPGGAPLAESIGFRFTATAGTVYVLVAGAFPAGTPATLRFLIERVQLSPESRPAGFTIGDTVSGELLEPSSDVDAFTTSGTPGREAVVVAEAPGALGEARLSFSLIDSSSSTGLVRYLGGGTVQVGGLPRTSGRFTIPASGRLALRFQSIDGLPSRFHGAYRFWSYLIDRAPEHRAEAVATGQEITGESIDRAGDVDEFTFTAAAGAELNVFFQASRYLVLEIAPAGGSQLATATSSGADTALTAHSTSRFTLAQAGGYVVRIGGAQIDSLTDVGSFRFLLYPINRAPEHVAAAIVPGDTVAGEAIDRDGDIDEFTFFAVAGQPFNAFIQATDGSAQTRLRLQVVDADGTVVGSVESDGAAPTLLGQLTGRVTMRTTGVHRLRVMGGDFAASRSTGPYRLFLYPVNRRPESRPDTLILGDSVFGESIDFPGDLDIFSVIVPDSTGANLRVELSSASVDPSLFAQVATASGVPVIGAQSVGVGQSGISGRFHLDPGSYTVRVDGSQYAGQSRLRGSYRLWLYQFSDRPELTRDTVAVGDTVAGETISPIGDSDAFHFFGVRGQHVNVMLQGLVTGGNGNFELFMDGPGTAFFPLVVLGSALYSPALSATQTLRYELPGTGWYHATVSAGPTLGDTGAYRFAVVPVPVPPEHGGAALAVGDSVTNEAIDFPGDWDEFVLTGTPNQEVGILFATSVNCCVFPSLLARDSVTGDTLAITIGQNTRFAGPFRIPVGGKVGVGVFESGSTYNRGPCFDAACGFGFTGSYSVKVTAINRAPESVPSAYVLGDTVRTEAIAEIGDIDEYTVTATPGETLRFFFSLRAPPQGLGLSPTIVDPGTGTVLLGTGFTATGQSFFEIGAGVVVPAIGHLMIRVRGGGYYEDPLGTAPYQFVLRR